MSEKLENNRPFAEELSRSPHGRESEEKLLELKSHPSVIVRLNKWANVSTKEQLAKTVAKLNENKKLFASLGQVGMRVAKFDYVIGGKKNKVGYAESYAVVEKIDGENIQGMETIDHHVMEEIDQCYASYFVHLLHVLQTGGPYWSDMGRSQIVYGTRESDPDPHLYVVDVEPYTNDLMNEDGRKNDPPKAVSQMRDFFILLGRIKGEMRAIEKTPPGNLLLVRAQSKLNEIEEQVGPIVEGLNDLELTRYFSWLEKNHNRASS